MIQDTEKNTSSLNHTIYYHDPEVNIKHTHKMYSYWSQNLLVNGSPMRLDVLTPAGSMTAPGAFERPWVYMLHLNVSH